MNKLYIVMYHYTRDLKHSRYPEIKGLDVPLFKQQIEYFQHHFSVITMEDLIDSVERKTQLPENALLLTFDDGYIDNYTYALPILESAGFQGSFFIPGKSFIEHKLLDVNKIHYILASTDSKSILTDLLQRMDYYRGQEFDYPDNDTLFDEYAKPNRFDSKEVIFIKRMLQTVLPEQLRNIISSELFTKWLGISETQLAYELYMTEEQIRTLKNHGMFIGIHGYDHYWLGRLNPEQMQIDIMEALTAMDPFIDKNHWVMNYPYGNYSDEVLSFIASQGACLGLTTEVRIADLGVDNKLTLPRFDCNDFPPKSESFKQYH